jgi:hypothetical protein
MQLSHAAKRSYVAVLAATGAICVCAATVLAQAAGGSGTMLLAMAANTKQVVHYQWKQRISVTRKGKPTQPVIDQVSFDPGGTMRRTTISAPEPMGGIRGKIAAGVRQKVKDAMELVGRYNKPQQMVASIQKAQIGQDGAANTVRVESKEVILPGDTMTILVNATTHLAKHIQIKTTFDGGPMTVEQDYSSVPGGPNMMKNMNVSIPKDDLIIDVESYDFTQQSARAR